MKYVGGVDFYPVMMNITFSPGNQSLLISIEVINDSMIETKEIFTLHLTSFSPGVVIETLNATVIIVDDDSMILFHRFIPRPPGVHALPSYLQFPCSLIINVTHWYTKLIYNDFHLSCHILYKRIMIINFV